MCSTAVLQPLPLYFGRAVGFNGRFKQLGHIARVQCWSISGWTCGVDSCSTETSVLRFREIGGNAIGRDEKFDAVSAHPIFSGSIGVQHQKQSYLTGRLQ